MSTKLKFEKFCLSSLKTKKIPSVLIINWFWDSTIYSVLLIYKPMAVFKVPVMITKIQETKPKIFISTAAEYCVVYYAKCSLYNKIRIKQNIYFFKFRWKCADQCSMHVHCTCSSDHK